MGRSPLSQHILEAIDLLFDQRNIVNPLVYPWSVHGFLYATFPDKNLAKRGTGTLIGKNTVITAAHCLYTKELTQSGYVYTPAKEVYFFSGYKEGKYLHGAKAISDQTLVHPKYLQNHGNYDFGLLYLDDDIGAKMGFSSLNVLSDLDLNARIVNVTGYPGSMGALRHLLGREVREMYSSFGPVVYFDEDMLRYHIDTSGGQSGAGVWGLDSEKLIECYGIHILGSKVEGNGAVRINEDNFNFINNYLQQLNDI